MARRIWLIRITMASRRVPATTACAGTVNANISDSCASVATLRRCKMTVDSNTTYVQKSHRLPVTLEMPLLCGPHFSNKLRQRLPGINNRLKAYGLFDRCSSIMLRSNAGSGCAGHPAFFGNNHFSLPSSALIRL